MLKTRIMTAVIMAVVVLGAIFALPSLPFTLLVAFIILGLAGWESGRLARFETPWLLWAYPTALFLAGLILNWLATPISSKALLFIAALSWIIPALWLSRPQKKAPSWFTGALLAIILMGAWWAISRLQAQNPWLIVWLVLIVASADVGAYFSGRALGVAKLAPKISPGKTWAGAIGGAIAASVVAPLGSQLLPVSSTLTPYTLVLGGLGLAVASIVGDLFISTLKRQAGLKDSSALLPGHGGLMDRLDSLSPTFILFALAVGTF